jgi:putative transposase
MSKFRNRYRIESTRLQKWDYGWNAPYFITICTKNNECFFGEVEDGEMNLTTIGEIVLDEWLKTHRLKTWHPSYAVSNRL